VRAGEPTRFGALAVHEVDPIAPVIEKIDANYKLVRAIGGQLITLRGRNFGDEDADITVKIGQTRAEATTWENPSKLLVKTPPGVGADLDVEVSVQEPAEKARVFKAHKAFSYSRPYIFDMIPFIVGQPVIGPYDVTIHAYGLGAWDTKPVALINGQQCGKTTWVDNQTVTCTIRDGVRTELVNPEVKVGGQRSHCGIIVPGVCTVSTEHGSVNSVSRIKDEIAIMRARGGDLNELKKKLQRIKMRSGIWLAKNDREKPCDRFENCYPTTFLSSLTSAVLMMMGMGSVCLVLLLIRPLSQWIKQEFFDEEEELDENDPANALAIRAREFDSRLTLTGL
jgi:Na+-transporting methylmalonyl-CoA/oxaloacetate decarboxylase gamma subunit